MIFARVKQKLLNFYQIFIAPPKRWMKPGKCDVLLYDCTGEEALRPYLSDCRVEVLAVRGEWVNVPCFLQSLAMKSFWHGKPLSAYTDAVVAVTSPKVIITFIDNNVAFYEISRRSPNIKTVFLQNGWRGEDGDVFGGIVSGQGYCVDYMLVFNRLIGRKYSEFVSGAVIAAGSLKNNHIEDAVDLQRDTVVFCSQYHDRPANGQLFIYNAEGVAVTWEEFFRVDALVVSLLDKWCVLTGKRLLVVGRQQPGEGLEEDWFAGLLTGCEWTYVSPSSIYSSYMHAISAEIVVAVDSTLGYEAFGRGIKTALFTSRKTNTASSATNFGWPGELPDNGPFWTNHTDESEFLRIMDYLNTVSDEEWDTVHRKYADDLMVYDPGNSRFKALLKELIQETAQ